MALSFAFDASKETPQSTAAKRALIAQLMGTIRAPKTIGEGFSAIGDGIVANVEGGRAREAETAGRESADSTFGKLTAMLTGQGGATPSAGFSGAPGAVGGSSGGGNSYRDAIASIESAGSGDYNAIGPTNPKLGRALGRYQVMEANIGPWSRAALGREISADEFMASPELQDAIFDHRFGSYVDQYGPQGAAQAWFAGPGGVGKMDRRDVLGTSVSAYTDKFTNAIGGAGGGQPAPVQVASLDPSIGMPQAQPAQLPPIGPSGGPQMAAAPQQPGMVPQTPPMQPQTPMAPQQQPMQTAQGPSLQMLMEAAANPWLNEGQRGIVNSMIAQEMQRQDPAYQQQLRAGDLGIQRSELELAAMRNPQRKTTEINGRLVYEDNGELVADYSDPKTATVGNSVIDTRTGQTIYEGQPEAPSSVREYDAYAADEIAAGNQPLSRLEYEQALRKSGATNISNVVGGEGDPYQKKFWESMAAADAKSFTDAIQTGDQARRNRINLDRISQLASSTPQGMSAAIINTLGEFGIKTDGLDNVQAMESLISQMVPTQRPPGSGTISDADLRLYKASLPRLINSPGGNQLILETMYAINDHDIAASDIAARVAANELSPAEARKEMRQLPNPFDDWKDKVDASSGGVTEAPNQSQAPTVTTEEQYNALPPGSPYKAPDGSMRIKGNG